MAKVTLERLEKSFGGGEPVVRGLDLTIEDGEFLTFVGPSGSGKSTVMNLIAGLDTPTRGHIRIDGTIVDALSPRERNVAMVFQNYALYPHMNVARNIGFPLEVLGVERREREARVVAMADRLGIARELARKPSELSGGQRQRVALGRALVRNPSLCLFDEPLSNLDPALRTQMRRELKKLHEDLGATFIYVTHDQTEAMTLSTRVVVLAGGVVQQVDTPQSLYRHPANLFVARFVGTPRMNVVAPEALGWTERLGAHAAGDVLVGVRPEDVTVGRGPSPDHAPRGVVDMIEPMGHETWVTLNLGGALVIARGPADYDGALGSPAWLEICHEKVLVFDSVSGLVLPTPR